jgi:hypothetical protein
MMQSVATDILIIGGGSGGVGAAVRAARHNPQARVMLVESMDMLGGTSTAGGVNNWEPGVGGMGIHYELFERMSKIPNAIGVGKSVHFYSPEEPYGLSRIDPDSPYESSLRRSATSPQDVRRVHFEPEIMARVMHEMLADAGVEIRYRTRITGVEAKDRHLVSVTAQPLDGGEAYTIHSRYFVDSSGGCHLAKAAGCQMAFGEEPLDLYQEPSAPDTPGPIVNGVSQIFRVTPTAEATVDELPEDALAPEIQQWLANNNPATFITEYPNGDLCMNVLPTMQGAEFHNRPYAEAQAVCQARMLAHWHRMQTQYGFDHYRFLNFSPMVGVRENYRLVGRYVLREQDVRTSILANERVDIIAFADHPLDTHGERRVKGAKLKSLEHPYGIPYPCLLPQEYENLITASRGSSFSHIAASSCRLSRTMMALGEAAGVASAIALRDECGYESVPVAEVQGALHVPEFVAKVAAIWGQESPQSAA